MRRRRARVVLSAGVLLLLATPLVFLSQQSWKYAEVNTPLRFPQDHASHPEYKLEWWYYTGNLQTMTGERFGYQLTFFRIGVDPHPANPSRWAVRDLFVSHFAVTDLSTQQFRFAERMNRAGVGWAGALTDSYQVWNLDWRAGADEHGIHQLMAQDESMGLNLQLVPSKPPVPHGVAGFSRKGDQSGNASMYYSLTRLKTSGQLLIGGKNYIVEGLSWMDHEFGTSLLEPEQVGWDWFSIQLDNGTELMIFQLRRKDGTVDRHSSGTMVEANGHVVPIQFPEFTLSGRQHWQSVQTLARYPMEWIIQCPLLNLTLTVKTALQNQELQTRTSTGVNYWEGAVMVTGTHQGTAVQGRGYLEMTGYDGQAMSRFLGP